MSHYAYHVSKQIAATDPPFVALIMAVIRKADSYNNTLLAEAFPDINDELWKRYNAPGGIIDGDTEEDMRRANA